MKLMWYSYYKNPSLKELFISTFGLTLIFQNYLIPIIIIAVFIVAVLFGISLEEKTLFDILVAEYQLSILKPWLKENKLKNKLFFPLILSGIKSGGIDLERNTLF